MINIKQDVSKHVSKHTSKTRVQNKSRKVFRNVFGYVLRPRLDQCPEQCLDACLATVQEIDNRKHKMVLPSTSTPELALWHISYSILVIAYWLWHLPSTSTLGLARCPWMTSPELTTVRRYFLGREARVRGRGCGWP